MALARAAGVRLVSGTERTAAADLRPGDGRVPRRLAHRPGQRQSRGRIDPLVPTRAVRDAFDRSHRCHATTERGDVVAMTAARYETLLIRHPANPILCATDWPYPAHAVFNAGATLLDDGTTLLLCRVEDRRGHSHLCAARSTNGVDGWVIDKEPTLLPDPEHYPEELWGIEDPRITFVDELGK